MHMPLYFFLHVCFLHNSCGAPTPTGVLTPFTPFSVQVSVDNRYQKTFRSFKRLEATDCTPATTAAGTTTAEPTTTTSTTSTTTAEPTTATSTTSTTTAEPTTLGYCSYTNSTTNFKQGFDRYFADETKECAINTFDTSAVTDMDQLFANKATFNQSINNWATGAVTTMSGMFYQAAAFNQNINNWATGAVTDMGGMFSSAAAFNQNINGFNTGAVTNMFRMFYEATAFNQNITGWVFNQVPTSITDMFTGADLMTEAQKPIFTVE